MSRGDARADVPATDAAGGSSISRMPPETGGDD